MAASRGGGKQSGQDVQNNEPSLRPLVSVGVPVPVDVWNQILNKEICLGNGEEISVSRVYEFLPPPPKSNRGNGGKGIRSPIMAISFPFQLSGEGDANELIDGMSQRISEAMRGFPPFQLTLGKVDCVPGVGGGWSVVVEAAENAQLAQMREKLSMLLATQSSSSSTLFATPVETGFVARLVVHHAPSIRCRMLPYAAVC